MQRKDAILLLILVTLLSLLTQRDAIEKPGNNGDSFYKGTWETTGQFTPDPGVDKRYGEK